MIPTSGKFFSGDPLSQTLVAKAHTFAVNISAFAMDALTLAINAQSFANCHHRFAVNAETQSHKQWPKSCMATVCVVDSKLPVLADIAITAVFLGLHAGC
jgi:hypothetical protein